MLSKCTEAITSNANKEPPKTGEKRSAFADYIGEKLSTLNKRQRTIAEKRISDVLFELEMSTDSDTFNGIKRTANHFQSSYGNFNHYAMGNQHSYPMGNVTPQGNDESFVEYVNKN